MARASLAVLLLVALAALQPQSARAGSPWTTPDSDPVWVQATTAASLIRAVKHYVQVSVQYNVVSLLLSPV